MFSRDVKLAEWSERSRLLFYKLPRILKTASSNWKKRFLISLSSLLDLMEAELFYHLPEQNSGSSPGKFQALAGLGLNSAGVFPLNIKEQKTKDHRGQKPAGHRNQNPG
jgi:hypothetical protein